MERSVFRSRLSSVYQLGGFVILHQLDARITQDRVLYDALHPGDRFFLSVNGIARSKMLRPSRVTVLLCCAWTATLLYGEMIAYWLPLWTCSWPSQESAASSRAASMGSQLDRVDIAVLTDPQLMDWTSLRLPRESIVLEAAKFYTDLYMRRSFLSSILPHKPDVVLFLGDLFDGGPFLTDQEWEASLNRFKNVFYLEERARDSDIKLYYLSGNHDIGYSALHSHHPEVISRFERGFGLRNYRFTIQKVDFIVVDAQTLDGDAQGMFTSLTWEFVKNMSKDPTPNSRVLLTHIPLYRPDGMPCGPHRASPVINQRVSRAGSNQEITYQNYLTEKTSEQLLELIKPILVLSGHDHDQCSVTHATSSGLVIEHTLGTVSWQQGNLYPSFMLLSVFGGSNTAESTQVLTSLCFLPRQTHIYIWYLCLFSATFLIAALWPPSGIGSWEQWVQVLSSLVSAPQEKDKDEDCEFEMVWDAEGSMHLVKKATSKALPSSSSDTTMLGRGNAMVRSSVKKHFQKQEGEASISADMKGADARPSEIGGKSRARRLVFLRVLRVFMMLSMIMVVNVPLYMMLLLKDLI